MAEPTVVCPQCRSEIKLTESLAAPLLESVRRQYEQRLSQKDTEVAKREQLLQQREAALQKERASVDARIAERVQQECVRIAADEAKKARIAMGHDLEQKNKEI